MLVLDAKMPVKDDAAAIPVKDAAAAVPVKDGVLDGSKKTTKNTETYPSFSP